ncbi:hypothetical protein, partial [Mesomycoplasma ovipneumoniae]|uniref:hypothetical protein n=1 Tax=Mesomycoplasma ovipneumoniae TaxID=29562 RepID=UPI00308013EF
LLYEVNYLSKFFKMNMLEKINKSGAIKIIGKKLIVWDFSTYLRNFWTTFLVKTPAKSIYGWNNKNHKTIQLLFKLNVNRKLIFI